MQGGRSPTKLLSKTVQLHGARTYQLLSPKEVHPEIAAAYHLNGDYILWANGTGYRFLQTLFALAAALGEHELLHLPLDFAYREGFELAYQAPEFYLSNIIFMNYCSAQLDSHELQALLRAKPVRCACIQRTPAYTDEYIDYWKTERRLTVKRRGSLLLLSANGDLFMDMAQAAAGLSEYGDDTEANQYPSHAHYDHSESTAKSLGITLYYWHHGEGGIP